MRIEDKIVDDWFKIKDESDVGDIRDTDAEYAIRVINDKGFIENASHKSVITEYTDENIYDTLKISEVFKDCHSDNGRFLRLATEIINRCDHGGIKKGEYLLITREKSLLISIQNYKNFYELSKEVDTFGFE